MYTHTLTIQVRRGALRKCSLPALEQRLLAFNHQAWSCQAWGGAALWVALITILAQSGITGLRSKFETTLSALTEHTAGRRRGNSLRHLRGGRRGDEGQKRVGSVLTSRANALSEGMPSTLR
jgi:hypothetical protein